jgi:multidrug efflux system membrane fusion protein
MGLLAAGCADKQARRAQKVPITVAQAEQRTIPYEIDATGTVEPIQSAAVTAQVGGLITRMGFHEGAEVRAGQVLFQIDPRAYQAAVAQAAAVLARDRAQAVSARLDFERADALAKEKIIAPAELDQKRAAAEATAATARADSALLANARLNLAYATVRAPISGKTGNTAVSVGDMVRGNDPTTPLVTIHQLRPIRVRFTVPQTDFNEIKPRSQGNLIVEAASAEADSVWMQGRLSFVDNQVDPASGTMLLKGEFPNRDGALWPGAFVRVRLRVYEQQNATVVPAVAISNSQEGTYIFVVKPDTTVEARPVAVQRNWGDLAVIASGLRPGETVVTDGQLRLSSGAKASIRVPGGDKTEGGGKRGKNEKGVAEAATASGGPKKGKR